jgi:hypothetical protein
LILLVPRRKGFDRLDFGFQDREVLWRHEHFDTARDTRLAADEACPFEGEDHLVDRGRGDAEEVLHLAFGGWSTMHPGVGVDECQVLPLPGRETGFLSARHLIHLSIRLGLQSAGGSHECTLSGRFDPIRAP